MVPNTAGGGKGAGANTHPGDEFEGASEVALTRFIFSFPNELTLAGNVAGGKTNTPSSDGIVQI
eukprot:1195042-Prorocentrum_minimum.AAC.6